jgi:hypothetical protein
VPTGLMAPYLNLCKYPPTGAARSYLVLYLGIYRCLFKARALALTFASRCFSGRSSQPPDGVAHLVGEKGRVGAWRRRGYWWWTTAVWCAKSSR